MFKKITKQFIYKFNISQKGLYSISISATCKSGKILGLFGGEDSRVEIDGLKLREIPAKGKPQYFNIPSAWNGTKLKGLPKTVIFILELDKGQQTIKFIPKRGVVIEKEPEIKLIRDSRSIRLNLNSTAENRNGQPWITLTLIDLPLKILDVSVKCAKRFLDSDDVKLIIDGDIQKNKQANWWAKNWYWQGRRLQGKTEETRFYPKLPQGIHYLEFWADRQPTLNWVGMDLGMKEDEAPRNNKIPTVDNPKWTGDFNDDTEQILLARTIFGEARSLPEKGRIAVGWSIRNRIKDPRRGDTYHKVILQPIQYSAFNKEDPNRPFVENPQISEDQIDDWYECYEIAGKVMRGKVNDPTDGANHYYSDYIRPPYWTKSKSAEFKIKIGNTLFYDLKPNGNEGFIKLSLVVLIFVVVILLGLSFTFWLKKGSSTEEIVEPAARHFFIHPVSGEVAVIHFNEDGNFLRIRQLTADNYNKSHLKVLPPTARFEDFQLGYFQFLHQGGQGFDYNNDQERQEYYENYTALMIMKGEYSHPYEVFRGNYHISDWEWDSFQEVTV
ncbi:cell wall hydrolase, partial [Patescibacteria group bacterium]|nr:cell wall hydrolase [Patescibacteria group bacterium]